MPTWAAITLPVVAFVWVAWLIVHWIDDIRWRHTRADAFLEWMNQKRHDDA